MSCGCKMKKKVEIIARKRPQKGARELAREVLTLRGARELKKILKEERARLLESKREKLTALRGECKAAKQKARDRAAKRRADVLAKWKRARDADLKEHAAQCDRQKAAILEMFADGKERARALAQAAADERAHLKLLKRRVRSEKDVARAMKSKERAQERIDLLRQEVQAVAPQMVPYFDKVIGRIRAGEHQSMLDAFFEMAEKHPEDVILAAGRKADREVAKLIAAGEPKWKQRAMQFEAKICERAANAARAGKVYRLKDRESASLESLGINPARVMNECYNRNVSTRRKVSERHAEAPF